MAYKCVVELVVLGFKQDHISHPGRGGTKQLQMKQHFNTIFCPNVLVSLIFYISQKRGKGDRREIFGRCLFLLTLLEEDFTKLIRQALMEVLFALQSLNTNSLFHWYMNFDGQGLPNIFSWELNIPKLLVVEEVGGANFHGFIFLWARGDNFFFNFKLVNHKDD